MNYKLLEIENAVAVNKDKIALLNNKNFIKEILDFSSNGYIVQYFIETANNMRLFAVLRKHRLIVISTIVDKDNFFILTNENPKFHLFERELSENFNIKIENHPWPKPVRKFKKDNKSLYDFYDIEGDGIHQVAVGPVHAGIIEPGHFRFNCIGEKILNLEIQLGYQHRGIEEKIINFNLNKIPFLIDSITGDSVIANSICFSQAIEGLSNYIIDEVTNIKRHILLEIERVANHIGDLGALSGDVAFLTPASFFGRIRGEFLNLLLLISGNRFGKNLIRPFRDIDFNNNIIDYFFTKLDELEPQIISIGTMLLNNPGVLGRFESTGIVSNTHAKQLGLVGVAGRASGVRYDVRNHYCTIKKRYEKYEIPVIRNGDVFARASIRFSEIQNSIQIIRDFLNIIRNNQDFIIYEHNKKLLPNAFIVTLSEAWRGEISHSITTDKDGNILKYKFKDPSFHNWSGLSIAVKNEEISDFPLCNKSFNLSYCGFDL
jgi:Ni,Fe-hydrogenase III large subunit